MTRLLLLLLLGYCMLLLLSSDTSFFVLSFIPIIAKGKMTLSSTTSSSLSPKSHFRNDRRTTDIGISSVTQMQAVAVPSQAEAEAENIIVEFTAAVDIIEKIKTYKEQLFVIADRTKRGFEANNEDRIEMNTIIKELTKLNPTKEPAKAYYNEKNNENNFNNINNNNNVNNDLIYNSVQGKWTLVYTDAPDITTLDNSPFSKLGRIGQECNPPYIKNVIEYTKPLWTYRIPFVPGTDESRILQKVVIKASASSTNPMKIELLLSGLQIESNDNNSLLSFFQGNKNDKNNNNNPSIIDINGPINIPFGNLEILYLDHEIRIIRTFQNYIAINIRQKPNAEWF